MLPFLLAGMKESAMDVPWILDCFVGAVSCPAGCSSVRRVVLSA